VAGPQGYLGEINAVCDSNEGEVGALEVVKAGDGEIFGVTAGLRLEGFRI